MNNKTFVIRTNELPEEMKEWDWKEVEYPEFQTYPEVPCVAVIASVTYGLVVPYQVAMTSNLRNYFYSFRDTVGVMAHNNSDVVFYVEEKSETKRKEMKKSLQDLFNIHYVV
ncbi:hypothetical protein Q9R46_16070 [Paenibacillus sp. RRE4]|uniref:Uncharacterized protein n=1 Tax=Paenibacillus silvae TaxID=1325358 RepID=A0ABQ1Z3Y2_9BACL|nr:MULTISPECIES: hypothetical protein [Paenibacillus]MDT0124176.1 hypothetical protein [Paenibacillus sp. RRE4]GGH46295.1 hypothetical protein GCM10008014_08860 [Paenibacillus silvae]